MKVWQQSGLLITSALVAGTISAFVHPLRPPWRAVPDPATARWRIDPAQALELMGGEAVVWIDARPRDAHEAGAISGSLLLNPEEWGELMFEHQTALQEAFEKPVIVYCDGEDCSRSDEIAGRLRELLGLEPVYVLEGDWRELQGAAPGPRGGLRSKTRDPRIP
jgi:rhodanese-related sulfurtransferase